MKIRTPYYYKKFKCIAGACMDTCCAGWDVDVDAASYEYYRAAGGSFGERLSQVMVPDGEGGCTFTLTADKRCPFLNEENLCDLYTELGEEHLCETCAEFPRFTNEYGSVRETGIAPSCITAGQLMFSDRQRMHFTEAEDGKLPDSYNDIDAFLYMQLSAARNAAFDIIDRENLSADEVCVVLLEFARRIQKCMDENEDEKIAAVVKTFMRDDFCEKLLGERKKRLHSSLNQNLLKSISAFFDEFQGMEVINPDWLTYVAKERAFEKSMTGEKSESGKAPESIASGFDKNDKTGMKESQISADNLYIGKISEFRACCKKADEPRARQLLDYYVYRYFLDSVNDFNLILKIKNAVVGYLVVRQLEMVCLHESGGVTFDEYVDIAHLYSRQFEHSYTNFEKYSDMFMKKRCYSINSLERLLLPQ